jgi:adenosylmethionine-8-amino-7-oxononanoate aminotransferase
MRRQLDALPSGTVMRYEHPPLVTVEYARALAGLLPPTLGRIRFGNTGSQLTEAAGMLSRFHRRMTGEPGRTRIVALSGAYHGTGPLATAMTAEQILHDYSAPVDGHVTHVPAPVPGADLAPVFAAIDRIGADRVTAVIFEPVLGNLLHAADADQLSALVRGCRERGIHAIADEVTTGAGRVGAMTVSERLTEPPDMIVLGKGLSGGYFPLAALAVADHIFDALADPPVRLGFPNGSTTDGHPLGAAAGLAVLEILTSAGFLDGVRERGRRLTTLLTETFAGHPHVGGVRGEGLLLGLELRHPDGSGWSVRDVYRLRLACRDAGLLTSYADGVLPLLPPLTISADECAELVSILRRTVDRYVADQLTTP